LQARGMDGEAEPFIHMDGMVTHYVAEIRLVQPHGPYFLCGYSFGGRLALEVARKLVAQGETVKFLGIIAEHFKTALTPRRQAGAVQILRGKSHSLAFAAVSLPARYKKRYMVERIAAFRQTRTDRPPLLDSADEDGETDLTPTIQK